VSGTELLINMTGRSSDAIFDAATPPVEDWDVGDPFGFNLAVYRNIRNQIEARVKDLAQRLREKVNSADGAQANERDGK